MNKNKNKILIYLNLNDEAMFNLCSEFKKSSYSNIICSSWNKYSNEKINFLSIQSLVDIDHYIYKYIEGYNIKNLKIYNDIFNKHFSNYSAMLLRRLDYRSKSNFIDFRNLFNIHYKFIEKFLVDNVISTVIMPPSASAGFDFLLSILPEYFKINSLFVENFHQSKFFYTVKQQDWGKFKMANSIFSSRKSYIYKKDPVKLFYVENYEKFFFASKKSKNIFIKFFKLIKFFLNFFLKLFFLLFKSKKNLYEIVINEFRKIIEYIDIKDFNKNSKKLHIKFDKSILSSKFVYFPLGFQPESTTLAYGDEYDDQLLAVDHLLQIIPSDWNIVIKEHPFQVDYSYRSNLFYKRLNNYKRVNYCKEFSSEELILKSQFVSIVSGNSGWESIRMGKNVLVFGRPWYLGSPGVTYIKDFSSINKLLDCNFSIEDISNYFDELSKKMGEGNPSFDYLESLDMFNNFKKISISKNKTIKDFANSLKLIMRSYGWEK